MILPINPIKTATHLILMLMMGGGSDMPPFYKVIWSKEPMMTPESLLDHEYSLSQLQNGYYQLNFPDLNESVYFSQQQMADIMSFMNHDEYAMVMYGNNGLEYLGQYIISKNLLYMGLGNLPQDALGASSSSSSSNSQSGFTCHIGVRIRQPDTRVRNMSTENSIIRIADIIAYKNSGDIKNLCRHKHTLQLMAGTSRYEQSVAKTRDDLLLEVEKSLIDLGHLSTKQLQQDRMLLKHGNIQAVEARLVTVTDFLESKSSWSAWIHSWHGKSWYDGKINLEAERYYLESMLKDPVVQLLRAIAQGGVLKAREAFESLNTQWSALDTNTRRLIEQQLGFHPIRIADFIIAQRSDSALIKAPSQKFVNADVINAPITQLVVDVLDHSPNMQIVGYKLNALAEKVFAQCRTTEFYNPEIEAAVYDSIEVISTTTSPHEFILHVSMIEQILSELDTKSNNSPTFAQRTPQLLGRALCKFFMGLNPITQTIDGVMSFVHLGQYIATVTVGEWYLTPEEYQNRVEGYAQTWDALSLENLQKLTAEQWVDMGAQMAANIFYGAGGISRTIRYLKHIDALAKAERQAAQIAQKMIQALDEVISKNPLVVTAEGLVMRMSNGVDKVKGATGEIIKDSKSFLSSTQIARQIEERVPEILKAIRPALENLAECGRKIKKIYAYDKINVSHIFSGKHIEAGLLAAGKTEAEIMHDFIKVIKKADAFDILKEGITNLLTYVDKIPVEIRVFVKHDTLMGFDAFIGHSARGLKHGIRV